MKRSVLAAFLIPAVVVVSSLAGCGGGGEFDATVPADIRAVMSQPRYAGANWALRVVDAANGQVLVDTRSNSELYIGSVRKIFSVGALLDQVGPDHRYDTPVYTQGTLAGGVLNGNLVLVASGDLTMGGRTSPDGSIAYTEYDHNESNSLGTAILTTPDPLAGYKQLAAQVAAAGITRVAGDVVIDDRLFQPFNFRNEFNVQPIFVNDDVVDLIIHPTTVGQLASVAWRPQSAALNVNNALATGAAGSDLAFELNPEFSTCIGTPGCTTQVGGTIPADYQPPFINELPLVRTARITQPSNYARTVFIEALQAAGVTVAAPAVENNPEQLLPAKDSYPAGAKVAELTGMPYGQDVKYILKVSYNIGADTSLVLWGVTQGVDSMAAALQLEQKNLAQNYDVLASQYQFVDGSGGGETKATASAVTTFLARMRQSANYGVFFDALPILGTDGSLAFVKNYESDPTLAGATGQVRAKTGTYVTGAPSGLLVKGQAFGGYIHSKGNRDLIYTLVVNNATVPNIDGVAQVFQDEGTISAILWRDF